MTPEEIVSRLRYRDELMLIINKPAGVAVHKGPKGGSCLEDDFVALKFGLPRSPALAQRLDRETSGCLVLGRHRKALANLSDLFRHGKIGKTYWAVVENGPDADEGRIDLPLGKLDDNRGWWMKPDPKGLPSSTVWKVMGRAKGSTWLALEPLTGRTHQLRVHCAAMGWPIVGDNIYGSQASARRLRKESLPRTGGPGLHLHAREVTVPLYRNRDPVRAVAPAPPHMTERLKACGWNGEEAAGAATPILNRPHSEKRA